VPEQRPLTAFTDLLRQLVAWCSAEKVKLAIVGGVAASLLARPRMTRDVDALIMLPEERWPSFIETGAGFGFEPRRPDVVNFALESRVFLLRYAPGALELDLMIGQLAFEQEVVERTRWDEVSGVRVPLVSPEDLIVMKALPRRERDLSDIEAVLKAHPSLDRERIRKWTQIFAEELADSEISSYIDRVLAPQNREAGPFDPDA
jgi:hypothetical protein